MWRTGISFRLLPPFLLEKSSQSVSIEQKVECDPELLWMWGRRQKFPISAKNEPCRLKTVEMCFIF
jgi:hypothetical protein